MKFNVFQTAYAVPDIDAAIAQAAKLFDIPNFQLNRDVPINTANGTAYCHFALAFVGETQIELIQPAGGADAVYRDALRPDGGLTLHHLGCLIRNNADWQNVLAALEASGLPIPVRGDFAGLMHYAYADTRAELGHYLEYMYQTEAGAAMFDAVPRFPGP